MKKKIILETILTLFLAFTVSAACIAPAFASVTYYDHSNGNGEVIINITDHQPPVKITVNHFDRGDHGVGDFLELATWQYIPPLGRYVWATEAIVTDNPSIAAFAKDFVFKGLPGAPVTVLLVKQCQLQVYRICKTVSAYWTQPIVTPTITLPPGYLLFRGYGNVQTNHFVHDLPNGVSITYDTVGYAAHATFVCPSWMFFGSVGDETTTMSISLDSWKSHS
jgi:hypothetical protein